ncbi:MFS transporter [Aestuariicella hydrocarbonica]|uniref:MFS transporter n=1 Tax=Pseudomaricurvus hydrocarbonicus TaxID=1470433 RepID=A0A9E5MLE4_9GAMM|nr:MFS transporter [Aestuariicella hydrocarbonica]NHO66892.1 MFS transporter [Aestuariicella hydrocarbonica]
MQADHHLPERYSPAYRNFVLALLVLVYVFNFIDRQLMTILLEPIKAEFGASDTAMGFLTGFAFALFYATLGLPIARLADRWSRRNVLSISVILWSVMTSLCAGASGFLQMALLRVGVGVGEAGGTPPSQSLIADYFPPHQRSTAMGIHSTGSQIGVLLGMFGGAVIADQLGWRMAFIIFGVPGVVIGLLVALLIKEPVKPKPPQESLLQSMRQLWALPAFMQLSLATAFTALSGYGLGTWFPSFLIRVHGVSLVEAGLILGLAGTFAGLAGAITGGLLCDRLCQRDTRWQLRLPAIGAGLSLIFMALFLLWPSQQFWLIQDFHLPVAVVFFVFGGFFSAFWLGPTYAAVQTLSPSHLRTQASAMLMLLLNLIGMGLGPVLIGTLSDIFTPTLGEQAIRYAMLVSLAAVAIGSLLYWRAAQAYGDHMDRSTGEDNMSKNNTVADIT